MALSVPTYLLVWTPVMCVSWLLHVIGLGTPHWMVTNINNDGRIFISMVGLFKNCMEKDGVTQCVDNPSEGLPDYFMATQAMILLGMLSGLLAIAVPCVMAAFAFFSKPIPNTIAPVCLVASIASAVFTSIGVIVFAAKAYEPVHQHHGRHNETSLDYSFALCIVGAVLMLAGGVLFFFGHNRNTGLSNNGDGYNRRV